MKLQSISLSVGGALIAASAHGAAVVRSGAGADAGAITAIVDSFRADLGGANNGVGGGPFATGRREINWDAPALDAFASPGLMPGDFFNPASPPPGSPRGASFTTPGSGFLVSQRTEVGGAANVRFGDINAAYPSIFQTFSTQRLFAASGSNVTDVRFFVPSSPGTAATVSGFGAVFADVDLDSATLLEFFDANNQPLFSQNVSPADNGLSFLGISFNAGERISRVRITAGNAFIGPGVNDGFAGQFFQDLVVMDDFIYSEPIPAPGAGAVALIGAAAFARRRR